MKLLTRLGVGLGRSGGLISFINRQRPQFQHSRRRSSIHVVAPTPTRRHMVTTATRRMEREREPSCQAPAPAADDTCWTILERWCCATDSTAVDVVAGANAGTVAETHTSRGPLRVSLSRAAPPNVSFVCFDWASHGARSEGGGGSRSSDDGFSHAVIAAHGDSVLLRFGDDYFVYKAAGGVQQPPSLSLLPACHIAMYQWEECRLSAYRAERELDQMDTGILRCGGEDGDGGGEFLVAQLQIAYKAPFNTAEICVLRPGRRDWELKEAVPIVHHDGGGRHDLGRWLELNTAVPAGNRFLCWVNYDHSTLLVCDMAAEVEENPKLRYVPLPVKAVPPKEDEWADDDDEHEDQLFWMYYRSIGPAAPPPSGAAADAPAAVRFVSIDRRCCCGAPVIRSACEHSGSAFTVTTWTLALTTTTTTGDEPMTWVKEGLLDCEEFWALLAGNEGLPWRAWPTCPVVSLENPNVVCFLVAEEDMDGQTKGKVWTLEVDMRRKTLISVVPCPPHPVRCVNYGNLLPAKLHS